MFPTTRAESVFWKITAKPWLVILLCMATIAVSASFIFSIKKNTSADAFIHPDNPALIYRNKIENLFDLKDPVVIMLEDSHENGVFNAATMNYLRDITRKIMRVTNIDPDGVTSLATEKHIVGLDQQMIVEKFFKRRGEHFTSERGSEARAKQIGEAVADFPLFQGSLVGRKNNATLIIAEVLDEDLSPETYDAITKLLAEEKAPEHVTLHIAGEAAVAGFLSTYIDRDAKRLNPLVGIIITIILGFAFFSVRGAMLPNLIVVGTVAITFGTMGASNVEFYVITNGLLGNLIGMAVADSIHIFSQYYEEMVKRPAAHNRELVVRAMANMWRPVTLTTVTTVAGFLALALSQDNPPSVYFGYFGALGVVAAWVFSMTLLPATMTVWNRKRLPRPFKTDATLHHGVDLPSKIMTAFGNKVIGFPKVTLGIALTLSVVGIIGATKVITNDAPIENFQTTEAVYIADKAINKHLDGTDYLDVVVEAQNVDDLLKPEYLARIDKLQRYLESLDHVGGTTSIVDYLKQMHRAFSADDSKYTIPDSVDGVAQLFSLYSDPSDFTDKHQDFKTALIRANVNHGHYTTIKTLVHQVEDYLAKEFTTPDLTARITGSTHVNYHWIKSIGDNHASSVLISFAAVLLVAMLVFRSVIGGLLAVLPVATAVLVVYAVMGFGNLWLGTGTSMFAAIAIGLGIDFAIHTLDRIRDIAKTEGLSDAALLKLYPNTGRALFFNFAGIAAGFGVLMTSEVPPLVRFGLLVAVSVATAFIAAMTIVPALIKLLKPKFLLPKH